jgi:protein SCO1/2
VSGAASESAAAGDFKGALLPALKAPREFTLSDQSGRRVSLRSFRGRVTLIAFAYPACGSTCILIAEQIRGALDQLARPIPVLFVSAAPAADTRASARAFLERVSLAGRALYMTGSRAALRVVWSAYHVVPASAGRAAFDRAAEVILLDGSGRERVVFGLETLTPESLAHDIRKLATAPPP